MQTGTGAKKIEKLFLTLLLEPTQKNLELTHEDLESTQESNESTHHLLTLLVAFPVLEKVKRGGH